MNTTSPTIGSYHPAPAACHEYDPNSPDVAAAVRDLIRARAPDLEVEHVGSTAIPGCAGKGIIDLMLLYPDGRLEHARDTLDQLGFQRQQNRDPWPESRPMRTGLIHHAGRPYRLHVHVIAAASPEAGEQRTFRDRLRNNPTLLAAYVKRKQAIIASGVKDTLDYCEAKADFIREVLTADS